MCTDVLDALWKCNYCWIAMQPRSSTQTRTKKRQAGFKLPGSPAERLIIPAWTWPPNDNLLPGNQMYNHQHWQCIFNLVISNEAYNFHLRPFPCSNIWALKTCWFKKLEMKGEFFCSVCWSRSFNAQEHLCLSFSFQKQKDGQCSPLRKFKPPDNVYAINLMI